MPDPEDTARVTMLWPADLKDKVRDKVGPRGLTPFAVEAVQALYDQRYGALKGAPPPPEHHAGEAAGDAEPVVSPPPKTSDIRKCEPGCGEDYDVFVDGEFEKHMAHKHDAKRKLEAEQTPAQDLPHDAQTPTQAPARKPMPGSPPTAKENLFEKLQAEGRELGIDLKPASEVLKPLPKDEPPTSPPAAAPEGGTTCPFHPEMAVLAGHECYKCTLEKNGTDTTPKPPVPEVAPVAPPAPAAADTCSACGSMLVDGECWECM